MTAFATVLSANASTILGLILEVAVKGTLLIAAAGFAAFAMRGAAASLRHLLWSFAIVAMLVIPALTVVLPRWQMGMIPLPATSSPLPASRYQLPAARNPLPAVRSALPAASSQLPQESLVSTVQAPPGFLSLINALALLWLGGVVAGLIAIVGGLMTLRRLARRSTQIAGAEWQTLLAELKAGLGITRDVRVLVSDSATMPATWGVVRPIVLLPAEAVSWNGERRRVVLLHELAHVQRNDCLMQIIAQFSCTVYWFHPGVWYSARQLRVERELACDEHVLGVGINACDYAAHLLEIARGFKAPSGTAIAGVAMARPSQLEGRLHAILSEELPGRWRASRTMRVAAVVTLAALTIPLAAMRPWREAMPATEVVASISGSVLPIAAPPDDFHWKGTVAGGQWVEIYSRNGDMRAELSRDGDVEVTAVRKSGDARNLKLVADRSYGTVRFCVVDVEVAATSTPCQTSMRGAVINGSPEVKLDFLVKIPAGVGISLHTSNGNITAESVRSYVWGTSGRGNIRITTTDLAEASTGVGSIYAKFGRRSWRQDLEFLAESGNVTVLAPSDASMMIEAETHLGRVRSEFPGQVKPFGSGQQIFATTGARRGMLTLRTGRGDVELRRGAKAVAELSDMPMSAAGSPLTSVDPKPNPNPNPEYDPDPNPNPDVEDADAKLVGDDPTGERVPVAIPENLVDRFTDTRIRGWADAQAIARLRNIAASHVKQHPADLVLERSEWALTLVRNGEIVTPLRNALANGDWRVRAYAAWALAETRDPRAADILTASLRDSHWRVRMHAASGLERIGNARAVDPLITALADNYWQVRISAVDALAAIGDRRALTPLRATAERDSRWIVRDQARNALGRIK